MIRLPSLTLRMKLVLLAVVAVAVTASAGLKLTAMHYEEFRIRETAFAKDRLTRSAQFYSERIADAFMTIEKDAQVLTKIPPISGLQRALRDPQGIDPDGGTPVDVWKTRLETVFQALLSVRPAYAQVRYIGLADNWREIVRVDRGETGPLAVTAKDLQSNGMEDYLSQSANMTEGEVYYSDISMNLGQGKVIGPPMIRFVHAVVDHRGQLFGAIVINIDYEAILRTVAPNVALGDRIIVMNSDLDYITFDGQKTVPQFSSREDPNWRLPFASDVMPGMFGYPKIFEANEKLVFSQLVKFAEAKAAFNLFVILETSFEAFVASTGQSLRADLGLITLLSVIAVLTASLLGAQITRPLTRLSKAVAREGGKAGLSEKDQRSGDEIEALAHRFIGLTNALLRERNRSKAIIDGAEDPIVTVSMTGSIEEINQATEALFGYEILELVGYDLDRIIVSDAGLPVLSAIQKSLGAAKHRSKGTFECLGKRKDGTRIPLEISVQAARYSGSDHLILVARDMSLRKEADRKVQKLIAALRRSNAELDKFAYIASHDLKAPLRVIDNASRWLEEDLRDYFDDDTRESMQMLRGRVVRMERLLDDLLKHARIGREESVTEIVSGNEMSRTILQLVSLPDGFDLWFDTTFCNLFIPRMPLQTILFNLISNAIKHHDRREGIVRVWAEVKEQSWVFSVSDDGPGIPQQYHDKIFEVFQTLKPRDQLDSSGMGLALVRKYVDIAGGRISVESDNHRGSIFILNWPKNSLEQNRQVTAA